VTAERQPQRSISRGISWGKKERSKQEESGEISRPGGLEEEAIPSGVKTSGKGGASSFIVSEGKNHTQRGTKPMGLHHQARILICSERKVR